MREIESYSEYVLGLPMVEESKHTNSNECRRAGRLVNVELQCTLGEIKNISATGMAILCRKTPPHRVEVLVGNGEEQICVLITRKWVKRLGIQKRLVGYQFIDPPDKLFGLLRNEKLPIHIKRVI